MKNYQSRVKDGLLYVSTYHPHGQSQPKGYSTGNLRNFACKITNKKRVLQVFRAKTLRSVYGDARLSVNSYLFSLPFIVVR